jgi:ribonuclease BN (tRNA processing enzyme)
VTEILDLTPAVAGHCGAPPRSSRSSQSFAIFQSRITVSRETLSASAVSSRVSPPKNRIFLGTGAPPADPDRSGPATAIVVNGVAYLVDLGPAVVRRANAAAIAKRIESLEPTRLRVEFITHLHSDHTVGYPDLIFTPWSLGRREPIDVYGPRGIKSMAEHLIEAYRVNFETRGNPNGIERDYPDGYKVNAHEITMGVIRSAAVDALFDDLRSRYSGLFAVARDLDVF